MKRTENGKFIQQMIKTLLPLLLFAIFGKTHAQSEWKEDRKDIVQEKRIRPLIRQHSDRWNTIGPPRGKLMIIGGAVEMPVIDCFMKQIGDPEALIVVIPTAGKTVDEQNGAYKMLVEAGAKNLTILHTRDPEEADTEQFVEPLRKAKGVFIGGGFQSRLAEAYLNTLTHKAMFELLDRGGIIAGSSAGASIQGSYLYGGGKKQRIGFGFVKESAINQHYIRRNRMGGLARVLKKYPGLLGIGIDENTAVLVEGDYFKVIGEGKVGMYDDRLPEWPGDRPQYYLFPGDRYDMASRQIIHTANPSPTDLWGGAGKSKWKDPAVTWQTTGPPRGKLILYGRDTTDRAVLQHFMMSVGKPEASVVVISAGSSKDKIRHRKVVAELESLGAANITFLHTIDRNRASSHSFTEALKSAEAVYICGDKSWQLADVYLHTLVHKELFGVLQRQGTVAGNNAGMAMMTSRLFGEPEGYRWHEGYGLIRETMVFKDSLKKKARETVWKILGENPELTGIGLSREAVLLVQGDSLKVSGNGKVELYKMSEEKQMIISLDKRYNLKRVNRR